MVETLPGFAGEMIARVRAPLAQAWTLPAAAYTSGEIYAREEARIFRRSWWPLARLDQVGQPGDYLSLDLAGQPVMVVHGHDGRVRVLSRVCRHRAALVAEGTGNRKLFTCPYHSWSYDTGGALVRAPLMEGAEGFDPAACNLPEIRSEVWEGFILANLDAEAPSFAQQVETYTRYFENFRLSDLIVARTLDFEHGWNWKVLAENFMEAYHHIGVHPETFEPAFHARDSRVPESDGPWSILHMPSAHPDEPSILPPPPGLEDWQDKDLFASAAFPHFLLGIQGASVLWYQLFPKGPDRLSLKIHICLPFWLKEAEGFEEIVEGTAQFATAIHMEDIAANDSVWAGLSAPLTGQGRLSPLEKSIWQMNQWWLDQMTGV
ncbi:aromatic ring-hydroxylating oxygenase subunit alpha [Hyphomonas sp. NPDC076900]|uniref:aromatic ring-hydroxylating oxygenase subunit alpha n=1 Tax=unclassified Hyphomonas TaxID=2630699 RepID=UPI003D05B389